MEVELLAALPKPDGQTIHVEGDTVPEFETPLEREGGRPLTIAPPLDESGRGAYVSSVSAPMASMKSYRSRIFAWSKRGVTVVLTTRIAYALNARQEWAESAPGAAEHDAAEREALADYEDLSLKERSDAESFGPDSKAPALVWCYLTHSRQQLVDLFRSGQGVCIVSPKSCHSFLRAVSEMGPSARIDNLFVEEVKGLSQMLFTKILPDCTGIEAVRSLAGRARRVFGFCVRRLLVWWRGSARGRLRGRAEDGGRARAQTHPPSHTHAGGLSDRLRRVERDAVPGGRPPTLHVLCESGEATHASGGRVLLRHRGLQRRGVDTGPGGV